MPSPLACFFCSSARSARRSRAARSAASARARARAPAPPRAAPCTRARAPSPPPSAPRRPPSRSLPCSVKRGSHSHSHARTRRTRRSEVQARAEEPHRSERPSRPRRRDATIVRRSNGPFLWSPSPPRAPLRAPPQPPSQPLPRARCARTSSRRASARARACTGVWLRRGRRPATRVPPWRRATQILSTRRGTRRSSRRTPRRRRRRSRRRRAAGGPRPARSRARSPRWSWREGPRDGGRSRRNPNAIPIRHSRERRRDSERALTPPPVSTPAALRSRFRSVQARPRGSSRARARRPLGARGGVCGGEGEARGPLFVRAIAPTLSRMRHLANVLEALPVSTRSAAPISSVATLGQTVAKTSVFRGRRLTHARRRERVPSVRSGGASSRSRARGGGFLRPRARCATSWRRPSGDGACPWRRISPPPMARLSRSSPPATTRSRG